MFRRDDIRVAYVGFAVPLEQEYVKRAGFSPAGSLAHLGFVEALMEFGSGFDRVWSFRPVGYYPKDNVIFRWMTKITLFNQVTARLPPLVNVFPLRNLIRYIWLAASIIVWAISNIGAKRVVCVYNIMFPHVVFMRLIAWLSHVRLVVICYDIGAVACYRPNLLHRLFDMRKLAERCLQYADGLVVITDRIAKDFAPKVPYVRIDGGITESVRGRLFPLVSRADCNEFRMFFAGGISACNHIELLLKFMRCNSDARLRLGFAGRGDLVEKVVVASRTDNRIKYHGLLSHDQLFGEYEKSDVVLNIRDIQDPAMKYHFPSKVLELLAIGRPLITTSPAHLRQVYGSYCKVIEHCSVESLLSAVNDLMAMSPTSRYELGARARNFILSSHTWKAHGPRLKEFICKEVCK